VERLWTPWRMTYVGGAREPGCVFCNAVQAGDDVDRLILWRGERAFAILNLYPYNSGHSMVVPYAHAADIEDLDPEARSEMFELATLLVEASKRVFGCDGFNLGLNLGAIAGAGVAEHLHLHVVPRWTGDANFMPILANTMVMPELLPVTYARLRAELERLIAERRDGVVPQAGGIVVLPDRGLLALRRGKTGDIGLPKGHVDDDETLAQTALREIREETGIDATLAGWAGSTRFRYPDTDGSPLFHVTYFIATGVATDEMAAHLESDLLLVPIDEAADTVTIPAIREMIERALPICHALAGTQR
jgi:ATP adenylyltransferase